MYRSLKMLTVVLVLLVAMIALTIPVASAQTVQSNDIVDTAIGAGDFTVLVEAVQKAGLEGALRGPGPLTVFAPTDQAFVDLLDELGLTKEQLLNSPDLEDILLYHVVAGNVMSRDIVFKNITSATTLQGSDVSISVKCRWFPRFRTITVNESQVITPDIKCSNGVIHVIDKVLIPPKDIVDTAIGAGSFTVLVEAVQKAGLEGALRGPGPLTVFAPTDQAFVDLLDELGLTKEQLLDSPDLKDILLYHVVSGKVMSRDIISNKITSATTLQGSDVAIAVEYPWFPMCRTIMVNDANVIAADIVCSNGVIHVIDKVLIPPKDIVDTAIGAGSFTVLVEAVQKAGLEGALRGPGPLTVFAPTDQAFVDLLNELCLTKEQLLNSPDLKNILLYHVVSGEVTSKYIIDNDITAATTLQGNNVGINVQCCWMSTCCTIMVNYAEVITPDIMCSNGVIHVIDKVLIP